MTRRSAWLGILSIMAAAFPVRVGYAESGVLTVNLTPWTVVRVTYRGQEVLASAGDIFALLREAK